MGQFYHHGFTTQLSFVAITFNSSFIPLIALDETGDNAAGIHALVSSLPLTPRKRAAIPHAYKDRIRADITAQKGKPCSDGGKPQVHEVLGTIGVAAQLVWNKLKTPSVLSLFRTVSSKGKSSVLGPSLDSNPSGISTCTVTTRNLKTFNGLVQPEAPPRPPLPPPHFQPSLNRTHISRMSESRTKYCMCKASSVAMFASHSAN